MSTRPASAAALLVVDVQVGVVAQAWQRDRIVANMALAVQRARVARLPVLWVQHQDKDLPQGSLEWAWVPELQPLPGEPLIHKSHNSAFENTGLLAELDRLGVGRIFLLGASSNWCIRATAHAALERGFDLTLLSDAHTTQDMELAPGRVVLATQVIEELNVALQWLDYPGRSNQALTVAEAVFA